MKSNRFLFCSGFAEKCNAVDFHANRKKYEGKCKSKDFAGAMTKVEEFIKNPNANISDAGEQIAIKTECEPVVKQEIESTPFRVTNIQRMPNNSFETQVKKLKGDKAKIVDELMLVKSENQKIYLELQQKQREIENMSRSHQTEMEQLLKKHEKATQENNRLSHENKILTAQINQLKMVENICPNSENLYEVEKLLNHRIAGGKMSFLVRWKNYGPKHDQWVQKSDLHCAQILNEYLISKGLL